MDIVADESLDGPIVRWLQAAGHDVLWVAEMQPGAADTEVIRRAAADGRVIITLDRDFGQLVFQRREAVAGVLYLRLSPSAPAQLLHEFQSVWPLVERRLLGHFIVIRKHGIRIRPLPARSPYL